MGQPETNSYPSSPPRSGGCLRGLAWLMLAVLAGVLAFGAFVLVSGLYTLDKGIVEPVGALVRGLVVPVTPVIIPDRVTVVHQINQLARLETASYNMEKIIRAERNNDLLWGVFGESLIFVAYADVIAGVDLARMTVDDIQVTGPTNVLIHLPPAEIFLVDLDNERSYVADRDTGLLTRSDPELETRVRQSADNEIRQAALEEGILAQADQNAQSYLRTFLAALGFNDITFTETAPPPAPPYQQDVPKGYSLTPMP